MTSLRRDRMIKKEVFIKTTIKQQKVPEASSLSLSTESVSPLLVTLAGPILLETSLSGKKSILLSKQSREMFAFVRLYFSC